jgi:rusticyanin
MTRKRNVMLAGVAVLAATGLGTGLAVAASGAPGQPAAAAGQPAAAASPAAGATPGYAWYRYHGGAGTGTGTGTGMMSGSPGWMMSQAGYQWMTGGGGGTGGTGGGGGTGAPGWMRGGELPGFMMGGAGTDPGKVMGTLFAGAPGPRVSAADTKRLGDQVPPGAHVDRAGRTITFTTATVRLAVLASPSMPGESFRIAGMTNPAISVPAGARVTIELVNADTDMAHGLVIMPAGGAASDMPMMTAAPSFAGSVLWFLGKPTAAGRHTGILAFTAATPGSYQYLCPVPGHAREGMAGTFTVR